MRISDWSSDVCSSVLCPSGHLGYGVGTKSLDYGIEGGRDRRHSAKQLESVLANSQRLLTMHRIAVGVGPWARPFIAVVIADTFHRQRGKGGLEIVHIELARREVECECRALCGPARRARQDA